MTSTATGRRSSRQERRWANRVRYYTERLQSAPGAFERFHAAYGFLFAVAKHRLADEVADEINALAAEMSAKAYEWSDR